LLSGIETIDAGQHVNLLGAVATDSAFYRGGRLNAAGFVARFATDPAPPLSLLTIPGALDRPPPEVPVAAVELSDAAPRGIRFAVDERARLLRVADSLDVAVVAGSDNHGWGRTAAAWSVMRLPGWRDLTPGELDARIRATIRRDGSRSVQVVERTGTAVGGMGLAATLPALLWTVAATLSWPERMSWLVWIWGLHLVLLAARSRSATLGAGAAADATTRGTRGERRLIVGSIPLEGRVVRVRARPAP